MRDITPKEKWLEILDFDAGNEENNEETTGCKASVYAGFDDCSTTVNRVEVLRFTYFSRKIIFSQSERKEKKKAILSGISVSVVLDLECAAPKNDASKIY